MADARDVEGDIVGASDPGACAAAFPWTGHQVRTRWSEGGNHHPLRCHWRFELGTTGQGEDGEDVKRTRECIRVLHGEALVTRRRTCCPTASIRAALLAYLQLFQRLSHVDQ